jgi:hypothetical protein
VSGRAMFENSRARALRRLLEKANRRHGGSDVCHGCRRPLRSLETTVIGKDSHGLPLVVASCCTGRLVTALGGGLYIPDGEDPERVARAARIAQLTFTEPKGRA